MIRSGGKRRQPRKASVPLAKIVGLALALLMITAGVVWAIPSNESPNNLLTAIGPAIAGFGVALAYVTLRRRR